MSTFAIIQDTLRVRVREWFRQPSTCANAALTLILDHCSFISCYVTATGVALAACILKNTSTSTSWEVD